MKNYFSVTFGLMFLQTVFCFSMQPRDYPMQYRTSVIIPCHYKHAKFLPDLLECYARQTILPDEIIIALCEVEKVDPSIILFLKEIKQPFPITLIQNKNQLSAGHNRNLACQRAFGDILICQDADDIPHPQRIEVIKYLFENYSIDHIIHTYVFSEESIKLYKVPEDLQWIYFDSMQEVIRSGLFVANGPVAVSQKAFNTVHWDHGFLTGEDQRFNQLVYENFLNTTLVLENPLYIYRYQFSVGE